MFNRIARTLAKSAAIATVTLLAAHSAHADWFSLAATNGNSWNEKTWGASVRATKTEAIKVALAQCNNGKGKNEKCVTKMNFSEPGFYAIAQSPTYLYIARGNPTVEVARKSALNGCSVETPKDETCEIKWESHVAGTKPKAKAASPTTGGNCRPRDNAQQCQTSCQNGNCVVTYPNGCKIRVQVAPKYDPFSNRWNHPAPAC